MTKIALEFGTTSREQAEKSQLLRKQLKLLLDRIVFRTIERDDLTPRAPGDADSLNHQERLDLSTAEYLMCHFDDADPIDNRRIRFDQRWLDPLAAEVLTLAAEIGLSTRALLAWIDQVDPDHYSRQTRDYAKHAIRWVEREGL